MTQAGGLDLARWQAPKSGGQSLKGSKAERQRESDFATSSRQSESELAKTVWQEVHDAAGSARDGVKPKELVQALADVARAQPQEIVRDLRRDGGARLSVTYQ